MNGWNEWKNLVLDKLEHQSVQHKGLQIEVLKIRTEDLPGIQQEIASLKTRAAIWGSLTGGIVVILARIFLG
jgi:hypothetical protein